MATAPIPASAVPPEWIAGVAAALRRDGQAIRAGAGCTIEVQSINTGRWMPLMLPGNGSTFVSEADRGAVLHLLTTR